jgi:tetratricopeptide (TPR) repeat protein
MMPHTSRAFTAVLAALLCGCSSLSHKTAPAPLPAAAVPQPPVARGESESLMAAEMALRDGKCRAASEHYAAAATVSKEVGVASRAAQLALVCQQFDTARSAVARWRELDPWNGQAALAAALIALKRYDLKEAREAMQAWRDSAVGGRQDPLQFAASLGEESDPTALYRVFSDVLVGEDPAAAVLLAQARLAFAAQDMQAARQAAKRALELDAGWLEPRSIELRALSVLGEHEQAIAGARALDPASLAGENLFLLADLLDAAGNAEQAGDELRRLARRPDSRFGAEQRLISNALRNGDVETAERLLAPLVGEEGNSALAVLYLAQLAERRGDDAAAVESYRLLADTAMGLAARAAAARLMIRNGESRSGIALLDEYAAQNPDAALEVGATRATLLADSGNLKAALAGLDALGAEFPGHPDLEYTRATVLETGGRTNDAVAQFESALERRPEDPQLLNALGFTLADHKLRLAHAERLIRTALAASPDSPAIQDSLGWVLYRRGRMAQALPVLARAWQNSGDAEIAAHYGEVLWKSGEEGKARYIWQQALNGDPAHGNLLKTMARLTGEDVADR